MALCNVVSNSIELSIYCAIDKIIFVDTLNFPVGRNRHDGQVVDLTKLRIFRHCRTGHARKLVVQTEIILQRDSCQSLVFLTNQYMLFCFQCLMKAFGITATFHDTAGEFINDLDLAVYHYVVNIAMEQELGLQRLLQMIGQLTGWIAKNIFNAKLELNLFQTSFGGVDGPFRFIHLEIDIALQGRHNSRKTLIRIGGLRASA